MDSTQLREAPLVPASQATTIPQADTLVSNAVATAQSTLSGINSPQTDIPSTLFTSTSLSVDCRVSDKIKGKIWNNEYFDISLLLNNSILEDKFQLSISTSQGSPTISLEPVSKPRKFLAIDPWLHCFHVFVGVYCRKFPHEAPALMKYGEVIRDLAAWGHNWRMYDENFRFLRQSQPTSFQWDCVHWELWMHSQQSLSPGVSRTNQNNVRYQSNTQIRSERKPFGYCFRFSKGMHCGGCAYKHQCHKCDGYHFPMNCSFRGQTPTANATQQTSAHHNKPQQANPNPNKQPYGNTRSR